MFEIFHVLFLRNFSCFQNQHRSDIKISISYDVDHDVAFMLILSSLTIFNLNSIYILIFSTLPVPFLRSFPVIFYIRRSRFWYHFWYHFDIMFDLFQTSFEAEKKEFVLSFSCLSLSFSLSQSSSWEDLYSTFEFRAKILLT